MPKILADPVLGADSYWSHTRADTTGRGAGRSNLWIPAGGCCKIAAPIFVFTLCVKSFVRQLCWAFHGFITNISNNKSYFRQSSCIVILRCTCGKATKHDGRGGVVVHPSLPVLAVCHDGSVLSRLEEKQLVLYSEICQLFNY